MKYEKKIGIDIGRVIIGGGDTKDDTSFFSDNYLKTPEVSGAIESIAALRKVFGDNMWLVSKCGAKVQQRSLEWLRSNNFTRRTGIPEENFRFTPTRAGKAPIAEELELTHFVDDRLEILGSLPKSVTVRFLFKPEGMELERHKHHFKKVRLVKSWPEILGYFL